MLSNESHYFNFVAILSEGGSKGVEVVPVDHPPSPNVPELGVKSIHVLN